MNTRTLAIFATTAVVLVAVLAAGAYGLYQFGMQRGMAMGPGAPAPASTDAGAGQPGAGGKLPQSIAEGEEATRRHIQSGIKAGDMDPSTGAKVLYYHDPMVPGNKFDKPARSEEHTSELQSPRRCAHRGSAGCAGSR